MLTAHLPSGYLLTRLAAPKVRWAMSVALIGAVLPDFDMIWFHFVDHGRIHHHYYWVHIPVFWLVVAAVTLPLLAWRGWLSTGLVFFASVFLHLLLDTIAGGILWAAPFNDQLYTLVTVPATHGHWVASFLLHWTFLLELLIWAWAAWLWIRRGRV